MGDIILRGETPLYVRDGTEHKVSTVDAISYLRAVERFNQYAAMLEAKIEQGGQLQPVEVAKVEELNGLILQLKQCALASEERALQESRSRVSDLKEENGRAWSAFDRVLESNHALVKEQNRHREELAYGLIGAFGIPLCMFLLLGLGLLSSSMRQPVQRVQPVGAVQWTN